MQPLAVLRAETRERRPQTLFVGSHDEGMHVGEFGRECGERLREIEHALVTAQPPHEEQHDARVRNVELFADLAAATRIGSESCGIDPAD